MSTDEIVIMRNIKEVMSQHPPPIFGLSNYFHYPSLVFLIFGWVGQALGGIDLLHMRMTHALFGLAIILVSFFFFRMLTSTSLALMSSILLGSNHALILISRLAMRENSALLVELLSLTFLYFGFKKRSKYWLFLGGLCLGLSFYVYLPAKIVIFVWLIFLGLITLFKRSEYPLKYILKTLLPVGLGLSMMIIPLIISMMRSTSGTEVNYVIEHLLISPQAQEEERKWIGAPTRLEGLKRNFLQGVTAFNNQIHDNNYVYVNEGHGFLDPVSGVLLWIGVGFLLWTRSKKEADLLMLGGFFMTLLTLSTFFDKNPHYGRLLITLPFVSYLAVVGLRAILKKYFKTLTLGMVLFLATFLITVLNLKILADYLIKGVISGDDVGGTARYVEARKAIAHYSFYLITNTSYPYYSWGDIPGVIERINTFTSPGQSSQLISPDNLWQNLDHQPFSLLMSQSLWFKLREQLYSQYPNLVIHNIKPDGSLVAVEVI